MAFAALMPMPKHVVFEVVAHLAAIGPSDRWLRIERSIVFSP